MRIFPLNYELCHETVEHVAERRRWRHLTDVMPSTQWLMYTFCILRVYSTYLPMGLYVSDVVMIAAIKIVFNVFMNATKPDLFTRYFLCSRRWLALYK